MRLPTRLTLLFLMGCLVLQPRAVRADGLRKVDRAASGGGGERRTSGGSSGSSRGHSSGSSSGSRSGGGGSYHSSGHSSSSYGSDSDFSGTTYSMSSGGGQCGMYAHSACPGEFDSFALLLTAFTIGLPWMVPRLYDDPALVGYAPHPFAHGPGVLRLAPGSNPDTDAQGVSNVALAVDVESGYLIEGVVPASFAIRLQLPRRFEIDSRVNLLTDVFEQPAQLGSAATAHLSYRFAQSERFDFRTGLGVRMFTLDAVRLGFDLMYAVDSYIANNVVLRIELHMGSVTQAFVGQARSTLGMMFGRAELYAGYDHTSYIGEGSTARLGGPVVGVRAWF